MTTFNEPKAYRITSVFATFAVEVDERGYVTKAAPIIGWSKGRSFEEVQAHCIKRGWAIEELKPIENT